MLYVFAAILVVSWITGTFFLHLGLFIHVLLIAAVILFFVSVARREPRSRAH